MIANDTILFYGWWQFGTCLFSFVALLSIWWHIGRKQKDFGQVWLALSILCWSISGLVEVYFVEYAVADKVALNGSRSILSLCNSLFILLALPWFRYLPLRLDHIIKSKYWIYIVGIPFLFSVLPTLNKMLFNGKGIVNELDVYYALLTLLFLGAVLWHSFAKRRLPSLAYMSLLCILVTLVAQLYKLTDATINLTLFSAIFKTWLIMLFFALALSWVKELAENSIPEAPKLRMDLKVLRDSDRIRRNVIFQGFPGNKERKVALTAAQYELLHHFATAKCSGKNEWLEIRPKHPIAQKSYDINDHNEVKRLLNALLDGIYGKGNWTKELHLHPFKETLFELSKKRERKIRLRLPPENIGL